MLAHSYCPTEGRRHDAGMLRESEAEKDMSGNMTCRNSDVFCVYGDPAAVYQISHYIISPYRGGVTTAACNQSLFNKKIPIVKSLC